MDHFVNADKAYIRPGQTFYKSSIESPSRILTDFFLPQKLPPPRGYNYVSTQSPIVISKLWSEI